VLTQATVEGLQDQVEPQVNRSSMTAQAGFTGVYWSRVHSCWMQRLHFKGLCCEGSERREHSVFFFGLERCTVEAILWDSPSAGDLGLQMRGGSRCAFSWQPRPLSGEWGEQRGFRKCDWCCRLFMVCIVSRPLSSARPAAHLSSTSSRSIR
jgi:hypothetical protein